MKIEVRFHEEVSDEKFKFAVILAKKGGQWIFCKHKDRDTLEFPGGRREKEGETFCETILETARRELYEETGAIDFDIRPLTPYSVIVKMDENEAGEESFGMIYYAEVRTLEKELHSEIEEIILMDQMPEAMTYPQIQPRMMEKAKELGII